MDELFDFFKKRPARKEKTKAYEEIYFQINFDAFGAFLQVTDGKGKPASTTYLSYAGATRNALKTLESITEKNSFVIDWEKPSEKIYLNEYPFLMEALRLCDNLIDDKKKFIRFAEGTGELKFYIKNIEEKKLKASIVLEFESEQFSEFRPITESCFLIDGKIIELEPVGMGYQHLSNFSTDLTTDNLTLFLALVFSNLENIKLIYEDYQCEVTREKVIAKPCLIFEKIDENNSLYLRVGQTLPDLDVNVLENFDLYRYPEINELEKKISIKLIDQEPTDQLATSILKLLKKHQPKRKKAEREEIWAEDSLFVIPGETAASFIYNELPNLLEKFVLFGAEKLKTYKINTKSPKLDLKLGHEIDFFEGDVSLDFGEEKINLFDAISQFNKQRYVKLSDGSHALLNEGYVRKLERLFKKKGKGKKAQLSFFDLPAAADLLEEVAEQKIFQKSYSIFEGFNSIGKKRLRLPNLNADLRPYQKDGVKWLEYLKETKLGGCLADDMGLGKTLQAIAILAKDYPKEKKSSLIVMPKSLLFNWKKEIEKFAPQLTSYTFYGTDRDLMAAKKANLIFTTYAIMRNEIERLKDEVFHYVILDESQNIKTLTAQTTQAALILKSTHRLALSGTPIENNLGELYSLFRFLNPSMFGSTHQFNKDFLVPIQKKNDKQAVLQLRKKIYPFVLRRLKKDVLKDLPDKIEQVIYVEPTEEQKKMYHRRRQFYKEAIDQQIASKGIQSSQFFIFQALNELRQIATVPEGVSDGKVKGAKIELLTEQVFDAVANGHKILIFVNFLAAIETVSHRLNEAGIDFVSMTGATRDRQKLVNRFQNDPECKVFLMTLKTGGVGLNLTAANTIFIYDPWWNKAAENQAMDRAHRMGQKNKVLAYKLIMQGTIEEKILKLQELKNSLFDDVISSDSASLKSLSEEDIEVLLS